MWNYDALPAQLQTGPLPNGYVASAHAHLVSACIIVCQFLWWFDPILSYGTAISILTSLFPVSPKSGSSFQ